MVSPELLEPRDPSTTPRTNATMLVYTKAAMNHASAHIACDVSCSDLQPRCRWLNAPIRFWLSQTGASPDI
eukprot:2127087-Amphidinium_carterae.1